MNIEDFLARRPFAFHTTSATNLEQIRTTRVLRSATQLFEASGNAALVDRHRPESVLLRIGDATIHVRDQAPLHKKAISFENGWTFDRYIALLNSFVFFWPGGEAGPIARGWNHYKRYGNREHLVVLRIPMRELFDANGAFSILVTSVNSGAARPHPLVGKAPRGGRTHVPVQRFEFTPAKVVEIAIKHAALLPEGTQRSHALSGGGWMLL